MLLITWI
jgi:hypothetical protein